jgi:hypothetical protein
MFDKLPTIVQHIIDGFIASAAYVLLDAVLTAKGVTGIDWKHTLTLAVNAGAVGAASLASVLWLTPFSRKYGIGKR